ncbi:glycosyltransferase involved in cell wall biosynthesis [Duganella sp. 1411]|jgi:glycosyltransferase involved in cell wall biosynthesis|uniref:glycosyltransferase family 4 protein n=1 Tax=Duganella sp. 1411 TaxID=2806572 RepID=UPI001AE421F9|nr:glycosyltransferase family 4 protein [Duganella sp. 1411]MBP1204726.1 glycosyltransferase involved in cell wall biosynthesis [Duganella sp. 1411]
MNILLINHYAGSVRHGMEYRPYYLARAWVRAGHRVRIAAASSSHLRATAPAMDGRRLVDEIIDGIEYRWHAAPAYRGNGLGRAANMAAFVAALYRGAAALARNFQPDLVIASSTYPADIWPARRIAALAGARLAFEVHDLWPLSPMELGGMPAWHPFIALMQAAEDYAYRHADTVISILPHAGDHMAARGMAPHKLHVVPNGVDPDEWDRAPAPLPAPAAALLDALRDDGRTVVGYAGSHGLANALDTLLDAAALLRGRPLAFVLAGAGPDKQALQRKAAAAGLRHVHFLEPLAKRHMPALLRRFDLAYLGWRRQPLYRFGISPNKLGDYMMAARPIVHAVEAANDPVAEAGCGVSVAPAAPAALAAAIARLAALPAARRDELGRRGAAYARAHLDYALLADRFLAACAAPH